MKEDRARELGRNGIETGSFTSLGKKDHFLLGRGKENKAFEMDN